MKKNKAVFVTIVMTVMLIVIDAFLYKLSIAGFVALTGIVSVYGYYRCAVDFCKWLCVTDVPAEHPAKYLSEPTGTPREARTAATASAGGRRT